MTVVKNKDIVRRWIDSMNHQDFSAIDRYISDDWTGESGGKTYKGPRGFHEMSKSAQAAMPHLQMSFDELVGEGDEVAARYTITGTHEGEMLGIPATHKNLTMHAAFFYKLKDGKITETSNYSDPLSTYRQLGVRPPSL